MSKPATHQIPVWLRALASAEVGERPCGVSKHGNLVVFVEKQKQRRQGVLGQHIVSALGTVTSNVAKSPDGLLANIGDVGGQELAEDRDGASVDDDLSVLRGARSNVGECPSSLKLSNQINKSAVLPGGGLLDMIALHV